MYYHINDIIFLVRFPQFVGSPPRDVWTTAYWRGRPSATSPLSARTLTPISPFLSPFSNLLLLLYIYILEADPKSRRLENLLLFIMYVGCCPLCNSVIESRILERGPFWNSSRWIQRIHSILVVCNPTRLRNIKS